MLTLLEILQRTTQYFIEKNVPEARLNAELLLGHITGLRRLELYLQFERPIDEHLLTQLRPLVRRRGLREPLQYLISPITFANCQINIDSRALIPRPETELLLERTLHHLGNTQPRSILELGTGSGALTLSLAMRFPNATMVATDNSEAALELAAENARLNNLDHRVTFLHGDWWQALPTIQPFDLIISNPPYLTPDELQSAEPEVIQYEPHQALVSGTDGLDALLCIIEDAPRYLSANGLIALETGIMHRIPLTNMFSTFNWFEKWAENDLSGRQRFFFAKTPC